jgi:hypothetical protein
VSDWASYALGDLLMFAPEAYDRLFERANALWPAALALALLLFFARHRPRLAAPVLASAWWLVAFWFHHELYAQINLAGDAFAWLFVAGGALTWLLCASAQPGPGPVPGAAWPGWLLLWFALLLQPLLGLMSGRPPELFAIAPDPTALATVGFLLVLGMPWWRRWIALSVPLLWLMISALTLITLSRPAGVVPLLLALVAIVGSAWLGRRSRLAG